jgi:MOSC domain-containing protein YiiM
MKTGKLLGIAYKTGTRQPMIEVEESVITIENGLQNDYKGSMSPKRQITVLSKKDWETACNEVKENLYWTKRRANLYIDEFDFIDSKGKQFKIGDEVILEITGETKPCYRMDEEVVGLMMALLRNWRGGVTCKVIKGGTINIGDSIELITK